MNTLDQKKSLKIRLMERLGFRHVPDLKLQIIERDGRYHRAVGKIFVRPVPFIESFGRQVDLGLRVVERTYDKVLSRDRIPHKITVNVKLLFDLREADQQFAPIIATIGDWIVDERTATLVDLTLRRQISNLTSSQILEPGRAEDMETAIRGRIGNLSRLGVTLLPSEDAVFVKEIVPPERVQENRNEATNIGETIDNFDQFGEDKIKQALVAHMLRDIGSNRPYFKGLFMPESLTPTSEHGLDDTFRVLRQPMGRVYDN